MALRLSATGRFAVLSGGLSDLFDGQNNNLNLVIKDGDTVPTDVDTVGADSVIVTLVAPDNGTNNANGSYDTPEDDGTTSAAVFAAPLTSANALVARNLNSANDDACYAELFVGAGRTSGDKVGDFIVGGPGSSGDPDLVLSGDIILVGAPISVSGYTLGISGLVA